MTVDRSTLKARCDGILGQNVEWIAVDSRGALGMFSTDGFGPVPDQLIGADSFVPIWAEADVLETLPVITSARSRDRKVDPFYAAIARRGFYAYGYSEDSGKYVLYAWPEQLITMSPLLHAFVLKFGSVSLDLTFDLAVEIDTERILAPIDDGLLSQS